jgi:hypothetical protein
MYETGADPRSASGQSGEQNQVLPISGAGDHILRNQRVLIGVGYRARTQGATRVSRDLYVEADPGTRAVASTTSAVCV